MRPRDVGLQQADAVRAHLHTVGGSEPVPDRRECDPLLLLLRVERVLEREGGDSQAVSCVTENDPAPLASSFFLSPSVLVFCSSFRL